MLLAVAMMAPQTVYPFTISAGIDKDEAGGVKASSVVSASSENINTDSTENTSHVNEEVPSFEAFKKELEKGMQIVSYGVLADQSGDTVRAEGYAYREELSDDERQSLTDRVETDVTAADEEIPTGKGTEYSQDKVMTSGAYSMELGVSGIVLVDKDGNDSFLSGDEYDFKSVTVKRMLEGNPFSIYEKDEDGNYYFYGSQDTTEDRTFAPEKDQWFVRSDGHQGNTSVLLSADIDYTLSDQTKAVLKDGGHLEAVWSMRNMYLKQNGEEETNLTPGDEYGYREALNLFKDSDGTDPVFRKTQELTVSKEVLDQETAENESKEQKGTENPAPVEENKNQNAPTAEQQEEKGPQTTDTEPAAADAGAEKETVSSSDKTPKSIPDTDTEKKDETVSSSSDKEDATAVSAEASSASSTGSSSADEDISASSSSVPTSSSSSEKITSSSAEEHKNKKEEKTAPTEVEKDPEKEAVKDAHTFETGYNNPAADTDSKDFFSKRLIIGADDPSVITDDTPVISEHNGLYLIQFDTEKQARNAYTYYYGKVAFVEPDTGVEIVDNDVDSSSDEGQPAETDDVKKDNDRNLKEKILDWLVEGNNADTDESADPAEKPVAADTVMTKEDNPLNAITEETPKAKGYDIALIDTGVSGVKVADKVSVIGESAEDDNGHGTQMAKYIYEEATDAKILSIKALDAEGKGDISAVLAAMRIAIDNHVKVINLSMSAYAATENTALKNMVEEAQNAGVLIVGAAGNNGHDAKWYVPGNIEKAVIVGACDGKGEIREFSNFGDTVDYYVVAASSSEAAAIVSGKLSIGEEHGKTFFTKEELAAIKAEEYPANGAPKKGPRRALPNRYSILYINLAGGSNWSTDANYGYGIYNKHYGDWVESGMLNGSYNTGHPIVHSGRSGYTFVGVQARSNGAANGTRFAGAMIFNSSGNALHHGVGDCWDANLNWIWPYSTFYADVVWQCNHSSVTNHFWYSGWQSDSSQHWLIEYNWQSCATCGVTLRGTYTNNSYYGKANHNWGGWYDVSDTQTGYDLQEAKCSTCGRTKQRQVARTYTVTYNANGGTGAPGTQSFVFNSGAHISTTVPTRTGYTFANWNYSGHIFKPGDAIPSGWGSFTLTAQWTVNSYTASFNGNGGSDGTAITKNYGAQLGTLPSSSRAGYTFQGWYTAKSGGTKISSATTMPANDVTYYAHWNAVAPTVNRVTTQQDGANGYWCYAYVTDSGAGIARVQFPSWTDNAGQDDIQSNWSTSSAASGTAGSWTVGGQSYNYRYYVKASDHKGEHGTYNTHVYAYSNNGTSGVGTTKFTYKFTVTRRYRFENANGTYGSYTNIDSKSYNYGSSISEWNRAQDDTYQAASIAAYIVQAEDKTISVDIKRRTASNTIQVRYQGADGKYGSYSNVWTGTLRVGEGHTWNRAADATYKAASKSVTGTKNAQTVQVSVDRVSYTASFDGNGGSNGTAITKLAGNTLGTLPSSYRSGYTFKGWFTDKTNGTKAETTTQISNTTYYAHWTANTNTKYQVIHQQMNLDGSTYTTVETQDLTGTTDTQVTPDVRSYTGFTAPAKQTVTINGNGKTVVTYKYTRNKYYLDLNGNLDGRNENNINNFGTAVVTVNGTVVGNGVADFYQQFYYGSSYSIVTTAASGKRVVSNGTVTGTMGAGNVGVSPTIRTNYTVTVKDVFVDPSNTGKKDLGSRTVDTYWGQTVRSNDHKGSYSGYSRSGGTDASSITGNATIYNYYKAWTNINFLNPAGKEAAAGAGTFTVSYAGGAAQTGQSNEQAVYLYYGQTIVISNIKTVTGTHLTGVYDGNTAITASNSSYTYTVKEANHNIQIKTAVDRHTVTRYAYKWKAGSNSWEMYNQRSDTFDYNTSYDVKNYLPSIPTGYHNNNDIWNMNWSTDGYKTSSGTNPFNVTAETQVHVHVYPNTYTVQYNGNGNTGGTTNDSLHTYDVASNLTANGFTKTGYHFDSWNTKADGTGTKYTNSQSVTNLTAANNGTVTLYARWSANTAVLHYNGNGGTPSGNAGVSGNKNTVTYDSGNYWTGSSAARTGYTFTGYFTAASGGTQVFGANGNAANGTGYWNSNKWCWTGANGSTIELYAQWKITSYTITYNSRGGSAVASASRAYGSAVGNANGQLVTANTLPNGNAGGASSLKWGNEDVVIKKTAAGSGGRYYSFGSLTPGKTYTWTLVAKGSGTWESVGQEQGGIKSIALAGSYQTFTHTFTANSNQYKAFVFYANSASAEIDIKSLSLQEGGVSMPTTTRPGYTFNGWYTAASGGTKITGTEAMPANNVTYYAQWKVITYTINYDLNKGDGTTTPTQTNPKKTYTVEDADFTLVNPTRSGYTFAGWTGDNGTTPQTTVTIKKGTIGNKSYKAKWTANNYTVTYEDWFVDASNNRKVKLGSTTKSKAMDSTVNGSELGTDAAIGKYYGSYAYKNSTSAQVTTSGATVYRYFWGWTDLNIFYAGGSTQGGATVSFSVDGGKNFKDVTNEPYESGFSTTMPYGTTYIVKNIRPKNTYEELDKVSNLTKQTDGSYTYTPTAAGTSMNIYLRYKTYKISYDLRGGADPKNPSTYRYDTAAITLKNPTRSGYTFQGWTGSNGTTRQKTVTIPTHSYGNKSYTANWTINNKVTPLDHPFIPDPNDKTGVKGTAQNLITDVTKPDDAKIQYSLDNKTWQDAVPTKVDAGSYTVYYKITSSGADTVTGQITARITKINPIFTLSEKNGKTNFPFNKTFKVSVTGMGTLTAESSDTNTATVSISNGTVTMTPVNVGKATVTVSSAGTTNYNAGRTTYELTVDYGTITVVTKDAGWVYDEKEHNAGTLTVSAPKSGYTVEYSKDNKTWTKSMPQYIDVGVYTTYWRVSAKNYTTKTGTITTTITKADQGAPTITNPDLTYNLKPQNLGKVTAGHGGTTVTYSLTKDGTYSTAVPQKTNAGTYTVYYRIAGDKNHKDYSGSYQQKILKKQASMKLSPESGTLRHPVGGTFTYTYDGDGIQTVSISDPSVADVKIDPATKTVTITTKNVDNKSTVITVSAAEGSNYLKVSKTYKLTVGNTYHITYRKGDGYGSDQIQTIHFGNTWKTNNSGHFVKPGYTQKRWKASVDPACAGTPVVGTLPAAGTTYGLNEAEAAWNQSVDCILTAVWKEDTYQISYDLNKGSASTTPQIIGQPKQYKVTSSDLKIPRPTKTGYTFTGWDEQILPEWTNGWVNLSTGDLEDKNADNPDAIYSNLIFLKAGTTYTLNGIGNADNTRFRRYDTDGRYMGNWNGSAVYTPDMDQYVRILTWGSGNTDRSKLSLSVGKRALDKTIVKGSSGDRKYTANWTVNHYTIHFDPNDDAINDPTYTGDPALGNIKTTGTMSDMELSYEDEKTLNINRYKRNGYEFRGWNTKKDGSGTAYQNRQKVQHLSAKDRDVITLYAQWEHKTGKSSLTVKDRLTGEPVMDAEVGLYRGDPSKGAVPSDDTEIGVTLTDEFGETIDDMDGLEWGDYYWHIISLPDDRINAEPNFETDTAFRVDSNSFSKRKNGVYDMTGYTNMDADLTITTDYGEDLGKETPQFLYEITGTDILGYDHTYHMISDEMPKQTISTIRKTLPAGTYTINPVEVGRYDVTKITKTVNAAANGVEASVDYQKDKMSAEVDYGASPIGYLYYADSDSTVNTMPAHK